MTPNHFDSVAREWDMNKMHSERTNAIASLILSAGLIPPGSTGLEFGAGTGLLSFALKDSFREIVLMDSSAEMVRVTAEKISIAGITHLHPMVFDLEKNDYTMKTFDVVFSQMALHHVRDISGILSKFYRLLNPGGILIIADLYSEDGSFHGPEVDVHHGFDPETLAEILDHLGFHNNVYQSCYTMTKAMEDGSKRSFPVFLMRSIKSEK